MLCCLQAAPDRVNTHAAPMPPYPDGPPINAVLPSADSATLSPNPPAPRSPLAVSFPPCCFQAAPARANAHAAPIACEWTRFPSRAPIRLRSFQPPINAMSPRADSARLLPNWLAAISCVPVSFGPGTAAVAAAVAATASARAQHTTQAPRPDATLTRAGDVTG